MAIFTKEQPKLGTTEIRSSQAVDKPLTIKNAEGTEIASISNTGVLASDSLRMQVSAELLAASVDNWIWIADRAYQVTGVRSVHSVAGGASAAVRPRKVLSAATDAPGAAAGANVKELTTANIDLTAATNTAVNATLSATVSDLQFAVGDKMGLDFSGTLTALVGNITIFLKAI